MVYVDRLLQWNPNLYKDDQTRFTGAKNNHYWCHLYGTTVDELHVFAKLLGLKKPWFQNSKSLPHYDLTPSKRKLAVKLGAIEHTRKETVEFMNQYKINKESKVDLEKYSKLEQKFRMNNG